MNRKEFPVGYRTSLSVHEGTAVIDAKGTVLTFLSTILILASACISLALFSPSGCVETDHVIIFSEVILNQFQHSSR